MKDKTEKPQQHATVAIMSPSGKVRMVQDLELRKEVEANLAAAAAGKKK